jgi:hypothetical protein
LFAGGRSLVTVARHNLSGVNRFGQDGDEFPFCKIDMEAWADCPFDLRLARWFRSIEEATSDARPQIEAPAPAPTSSATRWRSGFQSGVRVELKQDGSRWLMWATQNGRSERRPDHRFSN